MQLWDKDGKVPGSNQAAILEHVVHALEDGKCVAVKGIGGYLLMVDATDAKAIQTLRDRKQRPTKPFAILYPDLDSIQPDCLVTDQAG